MIQGYVNSWREEFSSWVPGNVRGWECAMLIFRLICAVMVAWAMNWVLARPEAAVLVAEVPEMIFYGPIAGAIVGFFNLAKRQGWGLVVSVANGMWTGLLAIGLSGFLYLAVKMGTTVMHNLIKDFEAFMRVLGQEANPLIELTTDFKLIGLTIGTCAIAGLVSEILHWFLVRMRRLREDDEGPKEDIKSSVAKAGGPLS
jgi:hypothetical protein